MFGHVGERRTVTANARRWTSLALWVAMLAVFAGASVSAVSAARHPVAACVSFAIVALREFYGPPFDDARFERRINKQLERNLDQGSK